MLKRRALTSDQWQSVSKAAKAEVDPSDANSVAETKSKASEDGDPTVGDVDTKKFQRCPECSAVLKQSDINNGVCHACGAAIASSSKADGGAPANGAISSGTLETGGKLNPAHFPGDRKKIPAVKGHTGVMISHSIDPNVAKSLAVPGGEPHDKMHVTLAYLGKDLSSGQVEAVRQAMKRHAAQSEAYTGKIAGHGMFAPSETSEGRRVHCALVDSPDMHDFRQGVCKAIESTGVKVVKSHGFTPHVTLKYLEKGEAAPTDELPEQPLSFDDIVMSVGGDHQSFKMSKALWSGKYINELPDSAFLHIEGGGEKDEDGKTTPRSLRHFPVKDADGKVDLPHLRNALSRIPQSNLPPDVKAKATKEAQAMLEKEDGSRVSKAKKLDIPQPLDIVEGEGGTGILQTHEMGLLRQQVEMTDAMGWEGFEPDYLQIQRMRQLLGDDSAIPLAKAMGGYNDELLKLIDDKIGASKGEAGAAFDAMPEPDRRLLMVLRPVHIHTDIRLVRKGDKFWEGGEMLFPGNQFGDNELKEAAGAYQAIDLSVPSDTSKYKYPSSDDRVKVEFPAGAARKGDLGWMGVGLDNATAFPPGAVGSGDDGWSRYAIRSQFKWTAGKQSDTEKEFWLEAGVLSGLWLLRNVRLAVFDYSVDWEDETRVWVWERAWSQTPKSEVLIAMLDSGAIQVRKSLWCPVVKADDEKRLIWGIVLEPEVVDGQGDIYSADVIEKAAHDFLANYNRSTQIGVQHNSFPAGLDLVESWCAPVNFKMGTKSIKKGTWMMVTHIENDDIWTKVKDSKIRGYSIAGIAKVKQIQTP